MDFRVLNDKETERMWKISWLIVEKHCVSTPRASRNTFAKSPPLGHKIATFGATPDKFCIGKSPLSRQIRTLNRHFSPNFPEKSPLFATSKPTFWGIKMSNFFYFKLEVKRSIKKPDTLRIKFFLISSDHHQNKPAQSILYKTSFNSSRNL